MTDWNAVTAFMGQVVAWPDSEESGFVNLHYSMENPRKPKDPLIKGMGWPFRDVGALISRAAWVNDQNNFKDLWYCTSRQSAMTKNTRGNAKAIRLTANATHLKAIWIDMDVGPDDPKKYATIEEALKTAMWFREKVGLPMFSAVVGSGSGIHIYWISNAALTTAQWRTYASGLKSLLISEGVRCDAGLTTDAARILRVPGTFNHKTNPPKPVQLFNVPLVAYNFEAELSFLTKIAPEHKATPAPGGPTAHNIFADGADIKSFESGPAFKIDGPGLQAGIERFKNDTLLDPRPIFQECGFLREAFGNGGKDYDQTLWMYSVLCTTFMENGNAYAHEVSKEHETYSPAGTQEMYDRKVAERADRGIGYPSCATIAGAGCKSCATCPLFAKGKSPLNIRPKVTATVSPPLASSLAQPALPANYAYNPDGIICRVKESKAAGGSITTSLIPLFQCVLSKFWVQKFPDALNYTVTVDKGFTDTVSVPHGIMSKQEFRSFLGVARVLIDTDGAAFLENFHLSMLGKLRSEAAAQHAVPFGWFKDGGSDPVGFAYGGNVMMEDGSVRPCSIGDANIRQAFTPQGSLQDWYDAAATVTGRKRPELTTIMLMSFASPLIALLGKNATMFSVYGETAAGKSAAYSVGMAVWGHPKFSKGSEQSTRNHITTQMRETRNLPFYWDEIVEDKYRELVASVMHESSDGVEKGRNINGRETQKRGDWELMICAASNHSYREFLLGKNINHAAALVRVLEWKVLRRDTGPGQLKNAEAEALIKKLTSSYGMMGLQYARFLALNHKTITAELVATQNRLETDFDITGDERFWAASMAAMICAAKYAQQLHVDVDPVEIETFLIDVYKENKGWLDRVGMGGGRVDNTETILTRYLKQRNAEERMIWTNYMHDKQGKPPKPVTIMLGPQQKRNTAGGIEVRVAIENRLIVLTKEGFYPWLKEHKYSRMAAEDHLQNDYAAQFVATLRPCSGTIHDLGREPCIVIPVVPNTALWDVLMLYADLQQRAAAEKGVEPEPVDTGLPTDDNVVAFVKGAVRG